MKSITAVTTTLCNLMNIDPTENSSGEMLEDLIKLSRMDYGINQIQKCLIYAPDAIGLDVNMKYNYMFTGIYEYISSSIPLLSVFPPKTPVCFASMFTGALPEVHGIKSYEKPVLACDTIFDALIRAGRKVAIVAVVDSSIDLIFRQRNMDYYSESYDDKVIERALSLLDSGYHDFIVVYNQQYDDVMHKTQPESREAIESLKNHIDSFIKLASSVERCWGCYNRLIAFSPDHGAHINSKNGKGTHGDDIPQDMQVMHHYGVRRGIK